MLVTDNQYFLKGSNKNRPIITYEKGLAKPAQMTVKNITDTVIKGFGTGVGGFSNAATCLYAMAAIFKTDDPRRAELIRRIDLEREIVGQEIDRIKGADKPYLPTKWKQYEPIPDPASAPPEEVRAAYRRNSMVIAKKPYFFRYLYPELDRLYRRFEESYNRVSADMFGIRFKKLLKVPRDQRTKDQDDLIRRYEKYNPLITSGCAMNRLCRAVESEDFDLRFGRSPDGTRAQPASMLPTFPHIPVDPARLQRVADAYRGYRSRRQANAIAKAAEAFGASPDDFPETKAEALDALLGDLRASLFSGDDPIGGPEFLRLCHELSLRKPSFGWSFAWDMLDAAILPLIPQGRTVAPAPDPQGPTEYLGVRYSPTDATRLDETRIDRLIRAALGDYDGMGMDPSGRYGDDGSER